MKNRNMLNLEKTQKNRPEINDELLKAIRCGDLRSVRKIINSFGTCLKYWKKGHEYLISSLKFNQIKIAKLILEYDVKVNSENEESCDTALHYGVLCGDIEIIRLLLNKGAIVNAKNKENVTPLHIAAKKGIISIVEILLKAGACVNSFSSLDSTDDYTPLHYAAQYNREEVVKLLIDHGADVYAKGESGLTSLHVASKYDRSRIAKCLIDRGASVHFLCDIADGDYTPLHLCAMNDSSKVAELLLNNGSDINASTANGLTPIHIASRYGNHELFSIFISCGADVNAKTKEKKTPLFLSAYGGHSYTVRELLRYKPDLEDRDNHTALYVALGRYNEEHVKIAKDLLAYGFTVDTSIHNQFWFISSVKNGFEKIVEGYLKSGININIKLPGGRTLLHNAVENGHEEVTKLLLTYGCDVNAEDEDGRTPLYYAVQSINLGITKILLRNNANVKLRDELGRTLLHNIAYGVHRKFGLRDLFLDRNVKPVIDIAELLLRKGIEVESETEDGLTAIHIVATNGIYMIIPLLVKHNADINAVVKNGDSDFVSMTPLHIAVKGDLVETVNFLLKYGADINLKCNEGRTSCDYAQEYSSLNNLTKNHVVMLKVAGLYVCERNLQFIGSHYTCKFLRNYLEELAHMKSNKVNSNISFYDILTNHKKLEFSCRDKNVVQVIESDNYRYEYSHYDYLLATPIRNLRQRIERRRLLNGAHKFFGSFQNYFSILPFECCEEIFSNLSNLDIEAFETFKFLNFD